MAHQMTIETVPAQPIAAVRARVRQPEIGTAFKPALDKVWAFLKAHQGLHRGGHNVFLYSFKDGPSADGKMGVTFGVQVTRAFAGEGDVICTETPAGRVVSTMHVGPYRLLHDVHHEIQRWCATNGHKPAGFDWEIYGDWNDDQSKLETKVCYLL